VRPDFAFSARKTQQLAVVKQVRDCNLDLPSRLPTVRDADGLALSSRNASVRRGAARGAGDPERAGRRGSTAPAAAVAAARSMLTEWGRNTSPSPTSMASDAGIAHVGGTRLIDNAPCADDNRLDT
jgi:pantothenate synthetase